MLDDLKYIHMRDKHDALGVAEKQWQQLLEEPKIQRKFSSDHVYNVVLSGMGGSALAAQIASSWLDLPEPFQISRDYTVPTYVDGDTLFIASSYSGNTEETLASLAAAENKGAKIAIITSGGKLAAIAEQKNYALYLLPEGLQPRYATLYALRSLVTLLNDAQLIEAGTNKQLEATAEFIKVSVEDWLPTVAKEQNEAKRLALELAGTSPVIYSGPQLFSVAYKWKISINENAKNVAWCNFFPEFNHNEFLGWSSHPIEKPYRVVYLSSTYEHPRIEQRMRLTEKLLSGKWPAPIYIAAKGETLLEHMLWTMVFGDFVSLYLALLNGIDPTPVDLIENFKRQIDTV